MLGTLENLGDDPILVERVFTAKLTLSSVTDYSLTHKYGRHNDEFHMKREALTLGLKVIESRRIIPSHRANPWFAVDRNANEENGEVWFSTEVTEFASTRISIGLNDWDFAWKLMPKQPFVTPASIPGYTQNGFGAASRIFHNYACDEIIPQGKVLHKIIYNSWR